MRVTQVIERVAIAGILVSGMLLFGMVRSAYPQSDENFNGLDTCNIKGVKGTALVYSRGFKLGAWTYQRFDILANDTTAAGFASDSVKFVWGIQTYHPILGHTNLSKKYAYGPRVVCDTFDLLSLTLPGVIQIAEDGTFTPPHGAVDTTSLTTYAIQSRNIAPEWDVYYRIWVQGVTGNKNGDSVAVVFQGVRGNYYPTRSR